MFPSFPCGRLPGGRVRDRYFTTAPHGYAARFLAADHHGFTARRLFSADHHGFTARRLFSADHGHRGMAGFIVSMYQMEGKTSAVTVRQDDDLVRPVILMTRRRRPSRRRDRRSSVSDPVPFILDVEPVLVIRDVFILVQNVAELREADRFRTCHDDCARGGRRHDLRRACDDDRFFHDDRLFDDRRSRFHDHGSRTRLDDRAHQVHDVDCKLEAFRGFVVIPCEGCRGEDDRRSENGADSECPVDGLLGRVSYGREVDGFQSGNRMFLTS